MYNNTHNSLLLLKDGRYFFGQSIGKRNSEVFGEVCFTTGMVGYQHTITDPSFAEQIVTFTFPHIGNVGINKLDWERKKISVKGIIMRDISHSSHLLSDTNLSSWLENENISGISGIDTRSLTIHLRNYGSQAGVIHCFDDIEKLEISKLHKKLSEHTLCSNSDLSTYTATKDHYSMEQDSLPGLYKVIVVDFGIKKSIVSCLTKLQCDVKFLMPKSDFSEEVLKLQPDGILLSNGPGNPIMTSKYSSKEIRKLIDSEIPMLGICLGHQLISLAIGANTTYMKNGHRGVNHPVYDVINNKIEITSQNHGFTVEGSTLPDNAIVTHLSLFDNSIEGIQLKNKPVFSVQYHPEGGPGPKDSLYIFNKFIDMMKKYKNNR